MNELLTFSPVIWLILIVLATFRLAWLLTKEPGPFAIFEKARSRLNEQASKKNYGGFAWTLAELFNCSLCLGVYISLIVLAIYVAFPVGLVKFVILFLAISGAQTFLTLLIFKED